MKLTESQLRKIIREELKAVRADQLYITEMIGDTGSAGDEAGGSSLEDKKKQCANSGGKWVEEEGGYGHCKEIEELEEADDLSKATAKGRDEHIELRNDLIGAGYSKRFLQDRLPRKRYEDNPPPAHKLENLALRVSREQMTLDDAKEEFMRMYPQTTKPMEEAAGGRSIPIKNSLSRWTNKQSHS